jgi:hypothetical protein
MDPERRSHQPAGTARNVQAARSQGIRALSLTKMRKWESGMRNKCPDCTLSVRGGGEGGKSLKLFGRALSQSAMCDRNTTLSLTLSSTLKGFADISPG